MRNGQNVPKSSFSPLFSSSNDVNQASAAAVPPSTSSTEAQLGAGARWTKYKYKKWSSPKLNWVDKILIKRKDFSSKSNRRYDQGCGIGGSCQEAKGNQVKAKKEFVTRNLINFDMKMSHTLFKRWPYKGD